MNAIAQWLSGYPWTLFPIAWVCYAGFVTLTYPLFIRRHVNRQK